MYQIGDLIIYGNMGVCRVKDVAVPSFCKGGEEKSYYLLEPLGQQGEIYIPVDSKVFMRPVIHREEANRLIDLIPSMQAQAFHSTAMQELTQHYSAALNTHDCQDLIQLIMSIYAKKKFRQQRNQKFGTVDENYMKRAEELLNTEFSVALGIPPSGVPAYIAARVKAAQKRAGKA